MLLLDFQILREEEQAGFSYTTTFSTTVLNTSVKEQLCNYRLVTYRFHKRNSKYTSRTDWATFQIPVVTCIPPSMSAVLYLGCRVAAYLNTSSAVALNILFKLIFQLGMDSGSVAEFTSYSSCTEHQAAIKIQSDPQSASRYPYLCGASTHLLLLLVSSDASIAL